MPNLLVNPVADPLDAYLFPELAHAQKVAAILQVLVAGVSVEVIPAVEQ